MHRCPCLSGLPYAECCERFHKGELPPTATALMRSRFTAFALDLADYVLESWHPSTRPRTLELEPDIQWYRLDILGSTAGGLLDREGTVEFDAYFRHGDTRGTQHEVSQFRKQAGRWFYVGELV